MRHKIIPILIIMIFSISGISFVVTENLGSQEIIFLSYLTFWEGTVNLIRNTTFEVTASNSKNSYIVSSTTALAALDSASKMGKFDYTIDDQWYDQFGSL